MPTARRLKVDYSTVSRRIAELEKDLAVTLFERKSDGFILTGDGHRLFEIAEKMETLSFSVGEAFSNQPGEVHGRVRLATMEGIAAYYLSEKLGELNKIHPNLVVELVTERHLINLTKREADISIGFMPPIGQKLSINKAGTFSLGLFASAGYLASRGTPSRVSELNKHDFVDYVPDLVTIPMVHWLLDVIEPEHVVFRSSSMAAQQNAIASGRGVGLLPYFSAKRDPRLIAVLPSGVKIRRDLYVAVHQDIEHVGRIRALVRFVTDLFKSDSNFLNNP